MYYFIHDNSMASGSRFSGVPSLSSRSNQPDLAAVNVEYHLAPERPFPAAAYLGLDHTTNTISSQLGLDLVLWKGISDITS